jgi:disulfide bond formation protein DsbB
MKWGIYFAWALALAGILASFYYSEIALVEPCRLCWYQRSALIPLVVQLGIAAYKADGKFALYAYPLCLIGGASALVQVLLPIFGTHLCGQEGCKGAPNAFDLIPLPWVSMTLFALIAFLLRLTKKK